MKNTGKEYELFVASLQQAILNADKFAAYKNIKVEVDKKIIDNCGARRQFDIYWEYELGGLLYKTVIECKDHDDSISIGHIDALIGKIKDLPDLKAIFATKKGYQSGARKKAELNKIELLIVREQNNSDWTDNLGRPLVKKILLNMNICSPAIIQKFQPEMDGKWLKSNTKIDPAKQISLSGFDNEIYIEDVKNNDKYSLYDLSSRLSPIDNNKYGVFKKKVKLENAYIYYKKIKLKILSYYIEYLINKPNVEQIEIDSSKEMIGVVEYLQRKSKK